MLKLGTRFELTLDLVRRVAWANEKIELTSAARDRIARRRADFDALLANESGHGVYGVNQGQGEMIRYGLTPAQMERLARLKPFPAAVSFGEAYPARVVRAMVLARFANILDGHAFSTSRLADGLIDMLNTGPMPSVPSSGQGGAGEILALYPLFAEFSRKVDLEAGERSTLINGAPCGAAL
ncbi:MAG: aromatic amino acid lyase, partial [Dongiaceae bacterium]